MKLRVPVIAGALYFVERLDAALSFRWMRVIEKSFVD
jgi:hypothetical protein